MDPATRSRFSRRALMAQGVFGAVALGMASSGLVRAQDATPVAVDPGQDPLPSWADGTLKESILTFVRNSVDPTHPDFVPASQRIATFDNDGTLWCEYPVPVQAYFSLELARKMAMSDPESGRAPVFRKAMEPSMNAMATNDPDEYYPIFDAVNDGLTQQRYIALCREWLETAKDPETGMRFVDMVYQPQLELLDLLRASGYVIFVVSGSALDFMRAFAPVVYGIPPWQLVGTNYAYGFGEVLGTGQVIASPHENVVVVNVDKATGIALHVGLRPIIAVGNSDGDLEMLQYAMGGPTPGLAMLVHHTDAVREYAYDRDYRWSPFSKALDLAPKVTKRQCGRRSDGEGAEGESKPEGASEHGGRHQMKD